MNHPESNLQKSCVTWFRLQYPRYAKLLIAVPNGGKRNAREAAIMKGEGVVPGVADLLLLIRRGRHGSLGIEMKAGKGHQSVNQKAWEEDYVNYSNKYVICRSLESFMEAVNNYLKG